MNNGQKDKVNLMRVNVLVTMAMLSDSDRWRCHCLQTPSYLTRHSSPVENEVRPFFFWKGI